MSVEAMLDRLVPEPLEAFGDWDDVLARARVTRRPSRRAAVVGVAAAALLVALFGSPAFGILSRLVGRIDVAFSGKPTAPTRVQRQFFDMSVAAPPGMAPDAIASQTRRVGTVGGRVLYVAPTRRGGYCFEFEHSVGGCVASRAQRSRRALSIGFSAAAHRGRSSHIESVFGQVNSPAVRHVRVDYADGTTQELSFIWVTTPIDAGFFLRRLPEGHAVVQSLVALDAHGRALDTEPIHLARPPQAPRRVPRRPLPSPKPLPAPTAPLQQGSAPGITVIVGANRVAEFRTTNPKYLHASWACLKFMRYHEDVPFELGFEAQTHHGDRTTLGGLPVPVDGCEVQETYGHVWPDPHGYHSAVEIAFTARASRFFADRAAARELALFVRWSRHHAHTPTTGITVARHGAETTYSVRSTTGRMFRVTLRGKEVVAENVKPLAGPL